jgi:histidinol phosphatase-like enzyme
MFFDGDSTIDTGIDFIGKPTGLEQVSKSSDTRRGEDEHGGRILAITKPTGIAPGFLTENRDPASHARLNELLTRQGRHVDSNFYCPHHSHRMHPSRPSSMCRNQKAGKRIQAITKSGINPRRSFVGGNAFVNLEAGHNSTCRTVCVLSKCVVSKEYGRWRRNTTLVDHTRVLWT